MDYIGKHEIVELAEKHGGPKVSLYMPTYRAGRQVEQNSIRFKNLIKQAEEELGASGLHNRVIERTLKPAHELLESAPFWQQQADGFVLFASHEGLYYFRLPVVFDELVVVSDRFHLKPLLSLLTADDQFYVLSLSKKRVSLSHGSRFGLSELELLGMPRSLAEVLQHEDFEKQPQFHTGTPSRPKQKRDAIFFGTGDGDVDEKEHLERLFREVDKSLGSALADESCPLILAGVEYMLAIYRKVSKYPLLLERQVCGSPAKVSEENLHEQVWPIVKDHYLENLRQARKNYLGLLRGKSALASADPKTVILASTQGRIEFLFVPVSVQLWGGVDQEKGEIGIHEEFRTGDRDLLDFAAIETFSKRGKVYVVSPEDMPGQTTVGAVFRY